MHLYKCFMTHSTWYKGTTGSNTPIGILWHDTDAGNPYIKRYVQPYETDSNYEEMITLLGKNQYGNDWNHAERQAGVHAFIGKLADESVATVQTGTFDLYPWGCGSGSIGSCNGYLYDSRKNMKWQGKHFIQFEICDDGYKDKNYFNKVYQEAVEFTAYLCKLYNLDPKGTVQFGGVTIPVITCHQESYKLKLGSDHSDVLQWFKKFGKTMDDVRNDVAKIIADEKAEKEKDVVKPTPNNTTKKLEIGDVVKIIGTTYYDGKKHVPAWARAKNWIVSKVDLKKDRIVLGDSADGTSNLNSPFHSADLQLLKNQKVWVPAVGDLVVYNGSTHYTNPNALLPKFCKGGNAKITKISGLGTSKHPYHLMYVPKEGATVYGWVNSGTFNKKA